MNYREPLIGQASYEEVAPAETYRVATLDIAGQVAKRRTAQAASF